VIMPPKKAAARRNKRRRKARNIVKLIEIWKIQDPR